VEVKTHSNIKYLTWQFAKREVLGRYRGSLAGLLWSFFTPLLLLIVYTFVFSYVFKARWGTSSYGNHTEFAINLFAGMIVYNFFSEVVTRSPSLIISQVNYVKKIVFPLEIFSLATVFSAIFHLLISLFVFLLFAIFITHSLHWTVLLFPLTVLPVIFLTLGISWMLSTIGVIARDMNYIINLIMTVCMFFSPLFYPVSMLPAKIQHFIFLNPIALGIEQARQVLVDGVLPAWQPWIIYFVVSFAIMVLGYLFFRTARREFSDVI
jgi:lipopolysaccharide transport system permease protein